MENWLLAMDELPMFFMELWRELAITEEWLESLSFSLLRGSPSRMRSLLRLPLPASLVSLRGRALSSLFLLNITDYRAKIIADPLPRQWVASLRQWLKK